MVPFAYEFVTCVVPTYMFLAYDYLNSSDRQKFCYYARCLPRVGYLEALVAQFALIQVYTWVLVPYVNYMLSF